MEIDKEDALHLAKVLANVVVSDASSSGLEHASALETIKQDIDGFILSDEPEPTVPKFDADVKGSDLGSLLPVTVTVGSAGFLSPGARTFVEFDDAGTCLLVGTGDADPTVDDLVYLKRLGDELTVYQAGVLDGGYVSHVVSLGVDCGPWRELIPDGKIVRIVE